MRSAENSLQDRCKFLLAHRVRVREIEQESYHLPSEPGPQYNDCTVQNKRFHLLMVTVSLSFFLGLFSNSAEAQRRRTPPKPKPKHEYLSPDAKVDTTVRAYWSDGGVKLYVVQVLPEDSGKYLILFEGVKGPLVGKVLVHRHIQEDEGRRIGYSTIFQGEKWTTLRNENSTWGKKFYTQVPPSTKSISMSYSDTESQRYEGLQILEKHLAQEKSGELTVAVGP